MLSYTAKELLTDKRSEYMAQLKMLGDLSV